MIRDLWQDTRYGARMLRKSPGLTSVAVLSLALGIGAISTIFSFVNGIMLRPLPYPESERLALLDETALKRGITSMGVSFPNFVDWRQQNHSFEDIAAYTTGGFAIAGSGPTGGSEPEQLKGAFVSQGLFEILGVAPTRGRTFTADEDQPDHEQVVILSYGLWQRRFGADPNVIGQTVTLNNRSRTVIGIMPKGFQFPEVAELWAPMALNTKLWTRTDHGLQAMARLKPGVTIEQAQSELTTIAANIEEQNPITNEGMRVSLTSLRAGLVGDYKKALLILLGVVGFVLLIACVNVANLLLARATARQKEIAIRAALGANRKRIFRQLLTESVLLGLISGALGLMLALWGMELLLAAIPIDIPFWMKFDLDGRVLGFTAACSLLTGFVFGTAPALEASNPDLNETLKEGGRCSAGAGRHRLRSLLVVAEIALSLVLLVGAGLMMRSFIRLQHVDAGLNPEGVLTMNVALPSAKYREPEKRITFFQTLLERVRTLPGVQSAGAVSNLPLSGNNWGRSLTVDGRPVLPVGEAPIINHCVITPSYFGAMGIPILKGRDFDERDARDASKVTIIDERLAREYWPDDDPIGKRIRFGPPEDNEPWHTIVGVVREVKHDRLDASTRTSVYLTLPQMPIGGMSLAIRTGGRPENLISAMRARVRELDPDLPLTRVMPMTEVVARSVWQPRLYTALFGVFAAVALILATVGIYGVMSYAVTQRTREIGLRMALGAQRQDVLKLVVGQGVLLAAIGVGAGLAAALALTRLMSSLLFGVTATDPIIRGSFGAFDRSGSGSLFRACSPRGESRSDGRAQIRVGGLMETLWQDLRYVVRILLKNDYQQSSFFQQLLERTASVPGVRSAALTDAPPFSGEDSKNSFGIEGRPTTEAEWASLRIISPDYFGTMGIPLLEGRLFAARDTKDAPRVVIINQAMARRFWAAEDPIGKRLLVGEPLAIIGVVGNVKHVGLSSETEPEMYLPFLQQPESVMTLVARTEADPVSQVAAIRAQVQAIDQDQPVEQIRTMADLVSRSVGQPRFNALLLGLFAMLALVLAAGGIYGVISFSVSQRTHEIGIRMALGACASDVLKLVVGQGMLLTSIGVASGLAGAFALTRVMASLLFGVSATDPMTFAIISLLLAAVALLASYLPARRAARVDPMMALRHE